MTQNQKNKLIGFLIANKIPLREGINILEEAEIYLIKKLKSKEKMVVHEYEKRG